jgi:pimeloyl-ACP methyl ester carboxylesterase
MAVFALVTASAPGAGAGTSWWQVENGDGTFSISAEAFRRHVAPDAEPAVVEQSILRLRPQSLTPFLEKCPIERMPDVPVRSILCTEDRIVSPDYSRRAAHELLGVEAEELRGSHSPMASRPEALAAILTASRRSGGGVVVTRLRRRPSGRRVRR